MVTGGYILDTKTIKMVGRYHSQVALICLTATATFTICIFFKPNYSYYKIIIF